MPVPTPQSGEMEPESPGTEPMRPRPWQMGAQLSVSFPWDINYGKEGRHSLDAGGNFLVHFAQTRSSRSGEQQPPPSLSVCSSQEGACFSVGLQTCQSDPLHLQDSEEGCSASRVLLCVKEVDFPESGREGVWDVGNRFSMGSSRTSPCPPNHSSASAAPAMGSWSQLLL